MNILQAVGDYFALDIGTTALRVVQLRSSGSAYTLVRYGMMPIDSRLVQSDSSDDQQKLSGAIQQLIEQSGITTKNVIVGIPTNKMFATVVDLPRASEQEMSASIKYQAEQYMPMSLEEAKVDYTILGQSPIDRSKNEVLLAGVANRYSETRLDMVESAGLNVVSLTPNGLALVNSATPINTPGSFLILNFDDTFTDVVATLDGAPRLIRSIPTGVRSMVKTISQTLAIDDKQAEQFLYKFGVSQDKLEGQIYRSLEPTLEQLVLEFQKSIKFFDRRYPSNPITQVLITGLAASLPMLDKYFATRLGMSVTKINVWQSISASQRDIKQLEQLNDGFAVAVGLAEIKL